MQHERNIVNHILTFLSINSMETTNQQSLINVLLSLKAITKQFTVAMKEYERTYDAECELEQRGFKATIDDCADKVAYFIGKSVRNDYYGHKEQVDEK